MSAPALLKNAFPPELVDALITAYQEVESNFAVKKWKASELDAGHFVEASRRLLDFALTNRYTPIGKSLSQFSDQEIKRYEQSMGDESYRLLIPRVLKSIYNIRNKRGVGHLGEVSPNEMDATLILYSCKWVLGEFVRLASGGTSSVDDAQKAVDKIMERRLDLIWKSVDTRRILQTRLTAREQVLVLLYDENLTSEEELRRIIEYKNAANFRAILKELHSARQIEYAVDKAIAITPKGVLAAEQIILDVGDVSAKAAPAKRTKRASKSKKREKP